MGKYLERSDIRRAVHLAKVISDATAELEEVKTRIREVVTSNNTFKVEEGSVVVTVPPEQWVIREGKDYRDVLAIPNYQRYFKLHVEVRPDAIKEAGPESLEAIMGLVDQKPMKTRIGFRFKE
jgi:hypothetical protein